MPRREAESQQFRRTTFGDAGAAIESPWICCGNIRVRDRAHGARTFDRVPIWRSSIDAIYALYAIHQWLLDVTWLAYDTTAAQRSEYREAHVEVLQINRNEGQSISPHDGRARSDAGVHASTAFLG
jgi:hypothetical protein